jgi:hypothetical protein
MRPGSSRSRRPGRSAVRRDDDTDLDYHDSGRHVSGAPMLSPAQRTHSDEAQPGARPAITHNNAPSARTHGQTRTGSRP